MNAIAQTIADQIGRYAFIMMGTGNNKVSDGDSLIFGIKGCKQWNKIKVALTGDDTYTLTFYKIGRAPAFKITSKQVRGVYCDQLHAVIEGETGLYLTLGTCGR